MSACAATGVACQISSDNTGCPSGPSGTSMLNITRDLLPVLCCPHPTTPRERLQIAEALARLIARPVEASEIPRHLRVRLLHWVLYDDQNIEDLMADVYSPLGDKLATDVGLAFLKACGFDHSIARVLGLLA